MYYDRWERFERFLDSLTPMLAGFGGALVLTMPIWMILLGII